VSQKLTALKSQASWTETSTAPPQAPKVPPAPSTTAAPPDVLVSLVAWVKNNWVAMVTIGAVILFFIYQFLIKD
jgi:hypothetical protein